MNIFLPYENDVRKSLEALDDLRLRKQIVEVYELLKNAIEEEFGGEPKGYTKHPIYEYYKNNIPFLAKYGYCSCVEYAYRFHKTHAFAEYFMLTLIRFDIDEKNVKYVPFYMEGSKGQPNYIRTTENVSELYQRKLCRKWDSDNERGREPKWTNREVPEFYMGN